MSRVSALFDLQKIDSSIDNHNSRIASIQTQLADISLVEAARSNQATAETTLVSARSKQKDLEFQVDSTVKHADDLESKLYGGKIKGVKEMAAAQAEIETFRERRKDLDDQLVEAMEAVETATADLQQAKAGLVEAQADWDKSTASLRAQLAQLQEELPGLQTNRTKALKMVMPPDIPVYEKLRGQKQGVAVAEIIMGSRCGACRVELPIAKQRDVKSGSNIVNCPNCGRILYFRLG